MSSINHQGERDSVIVTGCVDAPVGRIMNSCMASLLPAWLPPLITLKAGTGRMTSLLPARSAMWRYRGTPFLAAPALHTARDTPRMALAPSLAAETTVNCIMISTLLFSVYLHVFSFQIYTFLYCNICYNYLYVCFMQKLFWVEYNTATNTYANYTHTNTDNIYIVLIYYVRVAGKRKIMTIVKCFK